MDSASEDLYMQQLQEYVNDEDKIITILAAASLFKINVNSAKELLKKFVSDNKNNLAVTYILTGILRETDEKTVTLVKDKDLHDKKDELKSVCSEVIYSIQKSKNIDFNVISLANKEELAKADKKPLLGFVVSKNCTTRTLKTKILPAAPPPTIKSKASSFFAKTVSKSEQNGVSKSPANSKEETNIKNKSPINKKQDNKTKQGGIANMFSKMPPKATKDKENVISNKNQTVAAKNENSNNGMKKEEDNIDEDEDTDVEMEEKPQIKQEVSPLKRKREPEKKDTKKGNKKPKKEKSSQPPNKRRRRIIQDDDSESDDLFEKEGNDDIIEKSDEEPEPVITKPMSVHKNKVRKAVEKTYQDEEGYIVTKTEYVFESASEGEDQAPVVQIKEKPKPKVETKTSSNSETDISPKKGAKGKKGKVDNKNQPSIMSFFKKK